MAAVLVAALWLASCAPAEGQQASAPTATASLLPRATLTQPAAAASAPVEAATSTPLPAATSRGPNLEATDPATVRLDSGDLQLVEFFRFT